MPRPRSYKTEAIVLRHHKLGEADRIVTLLTPGLGKLRAVAKGARRPKSKLAGHLELLTHCQVMLAQGRNLDVVTQAQTIESYLPLREDLWRAGCGLYLAELVDSFSEEAAESRAVFGLLRHGLGLMASEAKTELATRYFELRLLQTLGYGPELYRCLSCQQLVEPGVNFFSASGGGVLCPACADTEPLARPLSLAALKVLRYMEREDWTEVRRLRWEPGGLARELERLMREYLGYLLEKEVKSVAFLNSLQRDR